MKKAKKALLLLLCAALLVSATIAGTLAYLQAKTETVTNTFVAAGGPGPFVDKDKDGSAKFKLLEYEVTQDTTGKYTQTTTEVTENSYSVMPNTTIPKQVFVKLSRTGAVKEGQTIAPAPAYLYLEVANGLNASEYTWSVDTSNWVKLGTSGGNDIYQYIGTLSDENNVLTTVAADSKVDVIKEDKVVANDVELSEGEFTLSFNAYLAQASTGETDDPVAVFEACFGKDIVPAE